MFSEARGKHFRGTERSALASLSEESSMARLRLDFGYGNMGIIDDLDGSSVHRGKSLIGKGSRAQERRGSADNSLHNTSRSLAVKKRRGGRHSACLLGGNDGAGTIDDRHKREVR